MNVQVNLNKKFEPEHLSVSDSVTPTSINNSVDQSDNRNSKTLTNVEKPNRPIIG